MNESTVRVTVLIVTYNHARYVAAAIDSALMQEADFGVEILISEDFSTDGTREIVERYVSNHPERLSAIYSGSNVRSNEVVAGDCAGQTVKPGCVEPASLGALTVPDVSMWTIVTLAAPAASPALEKA